MEFSTWTEHNTQSMARRIGSLKELLRDYLVPSEEGTESPIALELELESESEDTQPETERFVDALEILQHRFDLSPFETESLFLACAVEFDLELAELCSQAKGSSSCHPTPALCFQLFSDPAWDLLSPQRPLKHFLLIDFVGETGKPQLQSRMVADPRVVSFLRGLNDPDERLRWVLTPERSEIRARLSSSQAGRIDTFLSRSSDDMNTEHVIQIFGASPSIRRAGAERLAAANQTLLKTLCCDSLPTSLDELDLLSRLWNRECRLMPVSLMVEWSSECDRAQHHRLENFIRRLDGLTIVSASEPVRRLGGTTIEMHYPTPEEQKECWLENLAASNAESIAHRNAAQFDLEIAEIDQVGRRLVKDSGPEMQLAEASWDACRMLARPDLEDLAQRITCKSKWHDFVLPAEPMEMLRQLVNQVRYRSVVLDQWGFRDKHNRGFGVTALFCGESGTGKTMAAEVIANDLRLDLFRIDLSSVVNKYIGETEKNLRKLFDAAERGGAILFFDEADALFGKRSEVKDSHDRYANIEVNYLLQRLETFRGLVILATNNKSHLDSAFVRRLRFIIDFPYPETAERREIWRHVFPESAPQWNVDAGMLAKLNIAGGNIHNIALNAAFAAAAEGDSVGMRHMLEAARYELIKSQKPLSVPGITWPERQEMHS
ncbi:MAG: ATP-binding protein [Planctomycetota bacterium]